MRWAVELHRLRTGLTGDPNNPDYGTWDCSMALRYGVVDHGPNCYAPWRRVFLAAWIGQWKILDALG